MFLQQSWPRAVVALLLAASASAQEPLNIDAYVGIVLRSHPLATQTRGVTELIATERRTGGAWPDLVVGVSGGNATPIGLGAASGTEWGYSISQTLPWPGARSARLKAADAGGRTRLLSEDTAKWNLELDARLFYWRLVSARRSVEIARRADADAAAVLELTDRRADVGEAREADRSRAQAERLHEELALRLAQRESAAAEAALRRLASEALGPAIQLNSDPGEGMSVEEIEGRRQALAQISPAMRAVQAAIDRENAVIEVARASRAPDIDVSWARVNELDKKSWSLGAGLRLPLWSGTRAEIARAEASASLERAVQTRVKLEVGLAFEAAVQQATSATERLRFLISTLVPTTRRTWELVRLSYEEGETSLLDLLDAQRTLRDAEIEQGVAQFDADRAWIEVERICGRFTRAGEKR